MTQPTGEMISVGDLFFQFSAEGDSISGHYLGHQPITWPDGKPGRMHFIDTGEGVYKITSTFNLDKDLGLVAEGAFTSITFVRSQPTRRGLNPVKIFDVRTTATRVIAQPQQASLPGMDTPSGQGAPMGTPPGGLTYHAAAKGLMPPSNEVPGRPPAYYLPDGRAVFGETPDGDPLDAYGRILAIL